MYRAALLQIGTELLCIQPPPKFYTGEGPSPDPTTIITFYKTLLQTFRVPTADKF